MSLEVFVPSQYPTIQTGINAVEAGGTVIVSPGTYNEGIIINKSLTLKSSGGASSTIIDGHHASENYYVVNILADNVTVNGFTITNSLYNGNADASGVVIGSEGKNTNIVISNNIIHDIGLMTRPPAISFGTFGINCGPVENLMITNNVIYNIGNTDPNSYSMGIFLWGNGPEAENVCFNITIKNNRVYDIFNPGLVADGINLGGDSAKVTVDSNIVTSSVKRGIVTNAFMDGGTVIINNKVTGASYYGVLLRSPYEQLLYGNSITGCVLGIAIGSSSASAEIHGNDIYDNTEYGLFNASSKLANATCNWWGSITGANMPGSDNVYGNVTFLPWLNNSILAGGQCVGGYGTEGKVNGGGKFISPVGTFMPDSSIYGKAEFNFEFKYDDKKGVSTGHVDFHFKEAKLKLHGKEIQWIAIENNKAYCFGKGKVNNVNDYNFQLTVMDSGKKHKKEDKLHLKIWDNLGNLVYDNEPGNPILEDPKTVIDNGNIEIHDFKKASQ